MNKYIIALLLLTTSVMNFKLISEEVSKPEWNMLPILKKNENDVMADSGQTAMMELPDEMNGDVMNENEMIKQMKKIPTNGNEMMSRTEVLKGLKKIIPKSAIKDVIKKVSKRNRKARKHYRVFKRGCPKKNYKYPSLCRKNHFCCLTISSMHVVYYLYKIYFYAKNKYGCKKAKLYVARLLYKLILRLPYWYKKYFWKKLVLVIYSWKC
jgi:hypothetical protein